MRNFRVIKLHIFFKITALSLYGIENEFKQVMLILFNNAQDAIKIQMDEKDLKHGSITISLSSRNHQGIIEVSDNGGGINTQILNAIFDPYFTTKLEANGTGIGLYIAKNIIETRMKGLRSVKNIASGRCFTVTLPLMQS